MTAPFLEFRGPAIGRGRAEPRPRALDLFAGAGGVSMGLYRAGFDVVGVDIRPQPRHPAFHDADHAEHFEFIQADALTFPLDGYDFIWASPPCQAYSASRTRVAAKWRPEHPELIEPIRERLLTSAAHWCIENVPGAPLRQAVVLCGGAFGLGACCADGVLRPLRRHRLFEASFTILAPPCHCNGVEKIGVYGNGGRWADRFGAGRKSYKGCISESREAMGIDWMSTAEISQAIPPVYAEHIGLQALAAIRTAP